MHRCTGPDSSPVTQSGSAAAGRHAAPDALPIAAVVIALLLPIAGCNNRPPAPAEPTAAPEAAETSQAAENQTPGEPSAPDQTVIDKPIMVTDQTFQEKVLGSSQLVVVDVWATWCGPCKMLAPELEQIAAQYAGRVIVAKVNVDDNDGIANRYKVEALPTLLFIRNGQIVERVLGYKTRGQIAAILDRLLASDKSST